VGGVAICSRKVLSAVKLNGEDQPGKIENLFPSDEGQTRKAKRPEGSTLSMQAVKK